MKLDRFVVWVKGGSLYTLTNYSWRRLIDYDRDGGKPMTRWVNFNNIMAMENIFI